MLYLMYYMYASWKGHIFYFFHDTIYNLIYNKINLIYNKIQQKTEEEYKIGYE